MLINEDVLKKAYDQPGIMWINQISLLSIDAEQFYFIYAQSTMLDLLC